MSLNKLMEELATIAVARHDAETRFLMLAAGGSADMGLDALDKLDHTFRGGEARRVPSRRAAHRADEAPRDGPATSCMSAELKFVDTNVLVYPFDGDSPDKQAQTRELLGKEAENIVPSTQVLGGFYVTVTRKLSHPIGRDMARKAVDEPCAFRIRPLQAELVRSARFRRSVLDESRYDVDFQPQETDRGVQWRPQSRFRTRSTGTILPSRPSSRIS